MLPQAVEAWVDCIPGEVLSTGSDVDMPVPPPSQFVVEPYVTTEPVQVGMLRPRHARRGLVVGVHRCVYAQVGLLNK